MHKLLDEYNNINIEKDTVEGASKIAHILLESEGTRLHHTLAVVENITRIMDIMDPVNCTKEEMIQAAYLHDIGYSQRLVFTGFHPYDGFNYLVANGWNPRVRNLVLTHSFSRELTLYKHKDLYPYYLEAEHSVGLHDLKLLALADFKASPKGETITLRERVEDIGKRYGQTNLVYEHARLVQSALLTDFNICNYLRITGEID